MDTLHVALTSHADEPALDTAVSHAVLERVAAGTLPATLRLYEPSRVMAFGRQDTTGDGYPAAIAAAAAHGFTGVERLAGGRAAVFSPTTLALSLAVPDVDPQGTTMVRFGHVSNLLREALQRLGVSARVGQLPGEYCPGRHSISNGDVKLVGIGQRVRKTAAHVGAVIVVDGTDEIRAALTDVYAALDLELDPATVGAITDVVPGLVIADVMDAVIEVFSEEYDLVDAPMDVDILARAHELVASHRSPDPS